MMWNEIMERVVAQIKAHPTIIELYTNESGNVAIRMASPSGQQQVPGIEWTLLGDTEGELWEPVLVQFDIWFTDSDAMIQTERILRGMFRQDLPIVIGGLTLLANYEDGSMLAVPDRSNFDGRGVRFRLAALRSQYAL